MVQLYVVGFFSLRPNEMEAEKSSGQCNKRTNQLAHIGDMDSGNKRVTERIERRARLYIQRHTKNELVIKQVYIAYDYACMHSYLSVWMRRQASTFVSVTVGVC